MCPTATGICPKGRTRNTLLQLLVYRKTPGRWFGSFTPCLGATPNEWLPAAHRTTSGPQWLMQIFKVARDHMRMSASLSFFYQKFGFLKSAFSLHICLHGSILFMFNHHLPPFVTLDPSQHIESLGSRKSNTLSNCQLLKFPRKESLDFPIFPYFPENIQEQSPAKNPLGFPAPPAPGSRICRPGLVSLQPGARPSRSRDSMLWKSVEPSVVPASQHHLDRQCGSSKLCWKTWSFQDSKYSACALPRTQGEGIQQLGDPKQLPLANSPSFTSVTISAIIYPARCGKTTHGHSRAFWDHTALLGETLTSVGVATVAV